MVLKIYEKKYENSTTRRDATSIEKLLREKELYLF
jgi:hypothetical protein